MKSKEIINLTTLIKRTSDKIFATIDNYRELDEKMESLGFSFIGSGLDKIVYASPCKKYVVKFQVGDNNQVRKEIQRYKSLPVKAKPFYIKPLAYDNKDFKWVINRKAKIEDDLSAHALKEIETELEETLSSLGISIGLNDIGWCNIGELDGKPIMIDYGY
jgi:hypothetical protein